MNIEDAEKIIRMLGGNSLEERVAVINGILFGIGFTKEDRRPNWELIKGLIEEVGEVMEVRDITRLIEIENSMFDTKKKMIDDCIELWESLRKEK